MRSAASVLTALKRRPILHRANSYHVTQEATRGDPHMDLGWAGFLFDGLAILEAEPTPGPLLHRFQDATL